MTFENVGTRDFQPVVDALELRNAPRGCAAGIRRVQSGSRQGAVWAMVSCRPKFPLWYFDRRGNDLRQMFPDEPAVDFVHELLRKCVVESENDIKLRDAGELLGEIDAAIAAVSSGRQLPGRNATMLCQFCGVGTYEKSESYPIVGNLSTTAERTYYLCDHCGHLASFIWGRNNPPPAWKESN